MTLDQLSNLVKDPKLFGILIVRPFGLLLQWLYSIVQNYGIAVILFALLVKLVCIPLTIKSKKSMLAMSAMNAELQQLQKKYANNRVKLNEEMQKLYEKHGVSPMSGCLPNLIPLPIMMGLYYAVQQPLQYIVGLSREILHVENLPPAEFPGERPLAAVQRPRDENHPIHPSEISSAASMTSSARCKNQPARSPVMPPNCFAATARYRQRTASAASASSPPPSSAMPAPTQTLTASRTICTRRLSAAVANVCASPVFFAIGNVATA